MQTFWSVKGGVGVTVVAAAVALARARTERGALLVDLVGDAPAVFGQPEPAGPGVRDWLGSDSSGAEAIERLTLAPVAGVTVLPAGASSATWAAGRAAVLAEVLSGWRGPVVVDAGRWDPTVDVAHDHLVRTLCERDRSFLVTRTCYLGLRRAVRAGVVADGVVVVDEPGRSLDHRDVADVLRLPVVARVELDPAVSRAVDAGLLGRRRAMGLERSLQELR